ncbi:hypothetical protein ACK1JC_10445 [Acinetobacter sp. TY2]|uniref:hypothetical protein n=1 Tax=Acinetobacter sp. TY2 TaxID=3387403 RepID=UPI0039177731
MKYLVGVFIVLVLLMGYFINKNNMEDHERLKQAEITHQQKLEQEKLVAAQREKSRNIEIRLKQEKLAQDKLKAQQDQAKKIESEQQEYSAFTSLLSKWINQDNIAGSTARIAVSTPVTELRRIQDELKSLNISGCLGGAKAKLLDAMGDEISMYLYFMQNSINSDVKISELKISYYNKLAEAIESSTACKNQYSLKSST